MVRGISLLLGLMMLVQIIRPLGLPGLTRRADAWKIAIFGLVVIFAVGALGPQ